MDIAGIREEAPSAEECATGTSYGPKPSSSLEICRNAADSPPPPSAFLVRPTLPAPPSPCSTWSSTSPGSRSLDSPSEGKAGDDRIASPSSADASTPCGGSGAASPKLPRHVKRGGPLAVGAVCAVEGSRMHMSYDSSCKTDGSSGRRGSGDGGCTDGDLSVTRAVVSAAQQVRNSYSPTTWTSLR